MWTKRAKIGRRFSDVSTLSDGVLRLACISNRKSLRVMWSWSRSLCVRCVYSWAFFTLDFLTQFFQLRLHPASPPLCRSLSACCVCVCWRVSPSWSSEFYIFIQTFYSWFSFKRASLRIPPASPHSLWSGCVASTVSATICIAFL